MGWGGEGVEDEAGSAAGGQPELAKRWPPRNEFLVARYKVAHLAPHRITVLLHRIGFAGVWGRRGCRRVRRWAGLGAMRRIPAGSGGSGGAGVRCGPRGTLCPQPSEGRPRGARPPPHPSPNLPQPCSQLQRPLSDSSQTRLGLAGGWADTFPEVPRAELP